MAKKKVGKTVKRTLKTAKKAKSKYKAVERNPVSLMGEAMAKTLGRSFFVPVKKVKPYKAVKKAVKTKSRNTKSKIAKRIKKSKR